MKKGTIRLLAAIVGTVISMGLSWPYFRDFEYWAESETAWIIYFAIGFVLIVYVFMVFFNCMETLFEHDALDKKKARLAQPKNGSSNPEDAA